MLQAQRGSIVDANGNTIATASKTYSIYAVLQPLYSGDKEKLVKDKEKTATMLAKYLPMAKDKILVYLNPTSSKTKQVEFGSAGSGLSLAIKQQISRLKLPGIHFTSESSRLYEDNVFASHIIGQTTVEGSGTSAKIVGTMGLEKYFNKLLAGKNGHTSSQVDNYGYQLSTSKAKTVPAKNGGTVYTTLNSNLQNYLESLMSKVQSEYKPTEMTATLMNAKTGAIIAASQRPTFSLQTGDGVSDMWRNALVQDAYEPGSVMKIMTLSAAINSGHYNPNEYYQSGSIKVGGTTLYDWNRNGWGTIPLSQAFTRSSNVGMVKLEQEMGGATWHHYLKKFGFGQKTGVTLPDESSGTLSFSNATTQATTAYGQGIDVTVMQMLQAMSAVANNGVMLRPRIISKTVSANGTVTKYGKQTEGRIIKTSTAKAVRKAMVKVVQSSIGTGSAYKMNGVDVGVKTGTAQIAGSNGYLTGASNYIFSVAGMVPSKNPKYLLYITLKQPQNYTKAPEEMMAEIFKPLITRALALDAASDDAANATTDSTTTKMVSVTNKSTTTAQSTLSNAGYHVATVGTGNKVVQQLPVAGQTTLNGSRVILLTNGAMTMPDVSGWSKSDVLKLAQITGKKFKLKGSGYASAQSINAGALIPDTGGTITFTAQ
ncbi:cell division protein FtsI [Lacticaseibacillus thailandensis DSM 22698 = JCM 13996]|uniref:Cell division protein FtsI n=1 Tax=Lacticaseibacillus thailandensis DSM 22698 = JCM 13996 TaxID=1423810 RepID=A0A0R2CIM9_9LACO|nr:cell division protein FtsI [Lacticaseibacillus thailandensis DSM 22698 = JCM 13996]